MGASTPTNVLFVTDLMATTTESSPANTYSTPVNGTSHHSHGELTLIPPWFQVTLFIAFAVTFLIGTAANLLVASVIIRKRRTRRVIHLLTLNLNISDLTVLLIYLPLQMYTISIQLKWNLGKVSCRFFYVVNAFTVNASICTLLAITRDRYYAISYPMMTHSRGIQSIKWWIPIIWGISFFLTVPLLFVVDVDEGYCAETKWHSVLLERIYWIALFGLQIVLPCICFIITYSIIIYRFGKTSSLLADNAKRRGRMTLKKRQQKRQLLKMAIMLTVVYLVCSMPQHLIFFVASYGHLEHNAVAVYIFLASNFMMILNSALNPIIYGSQSDDIKRQLYDIFPCYKQLELSFRLSRQRLPNSTTSTTASNRSSLIKLNGVLCTVAEEE